MAVVIAALTFFLCNMTLIAAAVALAAGASRRTPPAAWLRLLRSELADPVQPRAHRRDHRERTRRRSCRCSSRPSSPCTAPLRSRRRRSTRRCTTRCTGLPNRVLFRERVEQSIAERPNVPFAVVHHRPRPLQGGQRHARPPGRRPAARRRSASASPRTLAPTDTVARLGGDEFAVVLAIDGGTEQERRTTRCAVGRGARGALGESFVVDELTLRDRGEHRDRVLYPDHGDDVDELLQRADVAMYPAKEPR